MPVAQAPGSRPHKPVRSYTPRWRTSPLTAERMATLLPRYAVADGRLDPEGTFGRRAPLVLEIGSGHGAAAIAYALAHPDHDVLAAEVHVPGVARMLAAAEGAGVTNLRVLRDDAMPFLRDHVPAGSLRAVHLFFPDPWPKARHAKRRFVQPHTLAWTAAALEPGGEFLVATDQEAYAAHVRAVAAEQGGWRVREGPRPPWRPSDGFEDKGRAAGRAIVELVLTHDAG